MLHYHCRPCEKNLVPIWEVCFYELPFGILINRACSNRYKIFIVHYKVSCWKSLSKEYLERKKMTLTKNTVEIISFRMNWTVKSGKKAKNWRGIGVVKLIENGRTRTVLVHSLIYYLRKGKIPIENINISHLVTWACVSVVPL